MNNESEARTDPDRWMSPEAVSSLWTSIGYWDLSRVTVQDMMEKGWFQEREIDTEQFDPRHFRVSRDDLLRYLVRKVARTTVLLAGECEARGIDAASVIAERTNEGEK